MSPIDLAAHNEVMREAMRGTLDATGTTPRPMATLFDMSGPILLAILRPPSLEDRDGPLLELGALVKALASVALAFVIDGYVRHDAESGNVDGLLQLNHVRVTAGDGSPHLQTLRMAVPYVRRSDGTLLWHAPMRSVGGLQWWEEMMGESLRLPAQESVTEVEERIRALQQGGWTFVLHRRIGGLPVGTFADAS